MLKVKTIKNEAKSNRMVLFMVLGTLRASLLGILVAGKNTKGWGICKNCDEYNSIGNHWIAFYMNGKW